MIDAIIGMIIILLIILYYVRLLSDKTDYNKIREIIKEELKRRDE